MRKVFCLVLALILTGSAIAEIDLKNALGEFNEYAYIFGAEEINAEEAYTGSSDLRAYMANFIFDGLSVGFTSKEGSQFDGGVCKCRDEAKIGEFIAYSGAMGLYLYGVPAQKDFMSSFMHGFLMARGGYKNDLFLVGADGVFSVEYEDGEYTFLATRY